MNDPKVHDFVVPTAIIYCNCLKYLDTVLQLFPNLP